ncbi:MAG: Crp/Fnr family transcriptional regulator [Candidatus Alcyoniella australis]|nr:Crp/Fnr family transcriptional regulator [Candidatus Alcyoniella australis]
MKFDTIEALKNIFIFSGMSAEQLESIAHSAALDEFKRGDQIYWEQEPPEALHILVQGKVKLVKQGREGNETIVGMVGQGETFGELAVLDGRPYDATALAMEPSTVLRLPRAEFISMLRSQPQIQGEIVLELVRRLRSCQEMLRSISSEQVEQRIARLLLKLAAQLGEQRSEQIRIGLHITRQEIANMVGTTVETTIRVLSRFTKRGLIETRSRIIYINDLKQLGEIAQQEDEL